MESREVIFGRRAKILPQKIRDNLTYCYLVLMKRTALALILALFSAVVGTQMVNLAEANPHMLKRLYCNISIQSPQNGTYNTEPVLLNFTVKNNHFSDYLYFYILDGQDTQSGVRVEEAQIIGEETISNDTAFSYTEYTSWGQAVLPNLSDGPHNLTLYAVDTGSIYRASETIYFSIAEEPEVEPFPTTLVIAPIASVAVIGLGLLVYFKKRKHKTEITNRVK